jgi:hypothetical protein
MVEPTWLKRAVVRTARGGSRMGLRLCCLVRSGYRTNCGPNRGWDAVHVAIDDATRLAYAETLSDETATTAVGLLDRAIDRRRSRRDRA